MNRRKTITSKEANLAVGDTLRERILVLALHEDPSKGDLFERWLVDTLPQTPSTPVRDVSKTDAQALAVWINWINSTIGRIALRKYGSRRASWPMYQPAAIKRLAVPNTANASWQRRREHLAEAYHVTKHMVVPQYREPNAEVRCIWDRAAAQVAGIPHQTVDGW